VAEQAQELQAAVAVLMDMNMGTGVCIVMLHSSPWSLSATVCPPCPMQHSLEDLGAEKQEVVHS